MADVTADDYAWFEEKYGETLWRSGFCLTFVRDLGPGEAFDRIGVAGRGADDPDAPPAVHPIAAYAAIGGAVLLEEQGHAGTLAEVTRRLSAGTVTAAVHLDPGEDPRFLFAADGHVLTGFEPGVPGGRWGVSPDRLLPHMRALGLPTDPDAPAGHRPGHAVLAGIALAERATGVRTSRRHLTRPALVGSAAHLY